MKISQEPKYKIVNENIVNRQSGEPIPEDEPIFILRARDVLAVQTLFAYWNCVGDNTHADAVMIRIDQFKRWARNNPQRMKSPDTVLTDDWNNL